LAVFAARVIDDNQGALVNEVLGGHTILSCEATRPATLCLTFCDIGQQQSYDCTAAWRGAPTPL
jgi:hypothetical protein